jgi:hypothetical protein
VNPFWDFRSGFYWVVGLLVSFVLGFLANVLSAPRSKWYLEWIAGRHLRSVLRLGDDEVIIVIPHQSPSGTRRLPQMAVEDVLALRNVFDVLSQLGIKHPKIRHPENLVDPDLKRNIISIGGSSRNVFTRKILELPVNGDLLEFANSATAPDQVELRRGSSMTYTSPSYSGMIKGPRAPSRDIAIILRRPNPKNETCSVIIVAGIRGIGTWGASDHLRKQAKKLSARIAKNPGKAVKDGFLAVIEVAYDNFDVVQTKIKDVTTVAQDA